VENSTFTHYKTGRTYFRSVLPKEPTRKDHDNAVRKTAFKFPQLIDYFIRFKENNGDRAVDLSHAKVSSSHELYVRQFRNLIALLENNTHFYKSEGTSKESAFQRILFLKDVIEKKGGYRIFYYKGEPIRKETDLQILYRLVWYGSKHDVTREANDGRGPVDFKISSGALDKTLVEMKLACNSQLKRNLRYQTEIYQEGADAKNAYKVILFFTAEEESRVKGILKELRLDKCEYVILIDGRQDNKPSASKAKAV